MFTVGRRLAQISGKQLTANNFGINDALFPDGGIWLARLRGRGECAMKKNEFSELGSNLLIAGSVSVAFMPFLLGDRLIPLVTGLLKDGGVMIDQFTNYLVWLVS